MTENRCRRARELAGLSIGQAADLLGCTVAELSTAEFAGPYHNCHAGRLAHLYGVSVDWILGNVPLRDYAAIDRIPGARSDLLFRDRDAIAELLAALPRRPR